MSKEIRIKVRSFWCCCCCYLFTKYYSSRMESDRFYFGIFKMSQICKLKKNLYSVSMHTFAFSFLFGLTKDSRMADTWNIYLGCLRRKLRPGDHTDWQKHAHKLGFYIISSNSYLFLWVSAFLCGHINISSFSFLLEETQENRLTEISILDRPTCYSQK